MAGVIVPGQLPANSHVFGRCSLTARLSALGGRLLVGDHMVTLVVACPASTTSSDINML